MENKQTHFRTWKSGKLWLYSATALALITAGGSAIAHGVANANETSQTPATSAVKKNTVKDPSAAKEASNVVKTRTTTKGINQGKNQASTAKQNIPMGYFAEDGNNKIVTPQGIQNLETTGQADLKKTTLDSNKTSKANAVDGTNISSTQATGVEADAKNNSTIASIVEKGKAILSNAIETKASADATNGVTPFYIGQDLHMDNVDVSSYQNWMTQGDYNALKAAGLKGITVKVSEGIDYVNPYAASQIAMAKAAGLTVAAYHFADFNSSEGADTPVNEANYFANQAKALGLPAGTPMILDAEATGTNMISSWTTATQQFSNQLKANGYTNPKVYTSASWYSSGTIQSSAMPNGGKDFWIAQYFYGLPNAHAGSWGSLGAWQATDSALAPSNGGYYLDASVDYSGYFTPKATNTYQSITGAPSAVLNANGSVTVKGTANSTSDLSSLSVNYTVGSTTKSYTASLSGNNYSVTINPSDISGIKAGTRLSFTANAKHKSNGSTQSLGTAAVSTPALQSYSASNLSLTNNNGASFKLTGNINSTSQLNRVQTAMYAMRGNTKVNNQNNWVMDSRSGNGFSGTNFGTISGAKPGDVLHFDTYAYNSFSGTASSLGGKTYTIPSFSATKSSVSVSGNVATVSITVQNQNDMKNMQVAYYGGSVLGSSAKWYKMSFSGNTATVKINLNDQHLNSGDVAHFDFYGQHNSTGGLQGLGGKTYTMPAITTSNRKVTVSGNVATVTGTINSGLATLKNMSVAYYSNKIPGSFAKWYTATVSGNTYSVKINLSDQKVSPSDVAHFDTYAYNLGNGKAVGQGGLTYTIPGITGTTSALTESKGVATVSGSISSLAGVNNIKTGYYVNRGNTRLNNAVVWVNDTISGNTWKSPFIANIQSAIGALKPGDVLHYDTYAFVGASNTAVSLGGKSTTLPTITGTEAVTIKNNQALIVGNITGGSSDLQTLHVAYYGATGGDSAKWYKANIVGNTWNVTIPLSDIQLAKGATAHFDVYGQGYSNGVMQGISSKVMSVPVATK